MMRFMLFAVLVALALPTPGRAATPKQVTILFEWDRTAITPAGRTAIAAIATGVSACGGRSVSIIGYNETEPSTRRSQELSEERAEAVRAALEEAGVTAEITVEGRGEAELARPTRDGIREPLNRRAVVTFC